MAKIMSQSNRIYYETLSLQECACIKSDLHLFNKMVHDAYDILYRMKYKGLDMQCLQTYLKDTYHVNDYLPLSAISKAKGILKGNEDVRNYHLKNMRKRLKQIDKKMREIQKKLIHYQEMKTSIIELDKAIREKKNYPKFKNYAGSQIKWSSKEVTRFYHKDIEYTLYLFEVQVIDVEIKHLKHRIKMLVERKKQMNRKVETLEKNLPMVCFGTRKLMKAQHTKQEFVNNHATWKKAFDYARNHEMMITGRRQGKYGNNLFKYHIEEDTLYYYASNGNIIKLAIQFHLHEQLLKEKVKLPHNTPGKAICYVLEDHGDYFIMKAMMELPIDINEYLFFTSNGTVGLDINADHFAIAESDEHGNLIHTMIIKLALRKKTTNQRKHMIREAVKTMFDYCEKVHKPLIIEKLNLDKKRQEMMYNPNKHYKQIISEFAFHEISECIYSRSYRTKIGVKEVNPAYTSQIGRWKYKDRKGITIHESAAYVIARRGQKYKERINKKYQILLTENDKKRHHWSQWHIINKQMVKRTSIAS